jgi:hypothetical protein
MGVILSEAKNLACEGQMFRLQLNMTTLQNTRDEAIVVIEGIVNGKRNQITAARRNNERRNRR